MKRRWNRSANREADIAERDAAFAVAFALGAVEEAEYAAEQTA